MNEIGFTNGEAKEEIIFGSEKYGEEAKWNW